MFHRAAFFFANSDHKYGVLFSIELEQVRLTVSLLKLMVQCITFNKERYQFLMIMQFKTFF